MKKWLIAALTLAWLVWELIAAYDNSPSTWPLTHLIIRYLPPWIYFPAACLLAAFLVWHFWPTGRSGRHTSTTPREGIMSKFEPVKWMTAVLALLSALAAVPMFMDVLPDRAKGFILIAIAVLTGILGKLTRDKVTPVARPRAEDGTPLIRTTR